MFIQPCFIRKNTPELREKLRKIGYRSMNRSDKEDEGECLLVCEGDEDLIDSYPFYAPRDNKCCNYYDQSQVIDCGTNEELFLALASLRDDTDVNQWFTNGNTWKNCMLHKADLDSWNREFGFGTTVVHKATVKELVEHFKDVKL